MINRRQFGLAVGSLLAVAACRHQDGIGTDEPPCAFKAPQDFLQRFHTISNVASALQREKVRLRDGINRFEKFVDDLVLGPQLALGKQYLWEQRVVTVSFLTSVSEAFLTKVSSAANEWSSTSGITFQFLRNQPSEIRIEVVQDNRNWCRFGKECLSYPDQATPTMHFGGITEYSGNGAIRATAIHEFGHALGAIHEHQSPAARINWNMPVVSSYYENQLGWSAQDVIDNIFSVPAESTTLFQKFDPLSIMIYAFPPRFTHDGFSVKANTELSELDRSGMKELYENFRKGIHVP